jgi:hypothetical protein
MHLYYTEKPPVIVREFGRNMQKMILYSKTLATREERQVAIERIVELVLDMYPTTHRNIEDYRIKVWSHILQICNYELDVAIPENVPLRKERIKPDRLPYPSNKIKYRHYGRFTQELIQKASEIEDETVQQELVGVIGAFMKMSYKTWNRDNASDEVIALEMRNLSKGKITLQKEQNIDYLIQTQHKKQTLATTHTTKTSGKRHQGGKGGKQTRTTYKKRK